MALPNVNIELQNGALGAVADSPDGVAGLVLSGKAVAGKIQLSEPKVIFSLAEAEALGIEETGDNADAHRHIKEFYEAYSFITGSDVAELHIMLVSDTMTLEDMCDKTKDGGAIKLLNHADGRIRRLGAARTPAAAYSPSITDGVDPDSLDALSKAQELGKNMAAKQQPIRTLIEARAFELANIGDLADLTEKTDNRAALVLWSTKDDGSSSVGYTLGLASALPVQRKISRVKNGALTPNVLYIGDTKAEEVTGISTINDKGYISVRTFPNRSGYYITDDPTASPVSDDYHDLTNGFVIDKAQRITYDTYVQELNDDVEIDADTGKLPAGYIAFLEDRITNNLSLSMSGEISGLGVSIDPEQNVLANGEIKIQLKIVPVGYSKTINVELGFDNPAQS